MKFDNTKQRLFEVMVKIDDTYKQSINENFDENNPQHTIGIQKATIDKVREDLNRLLQYLDQNPPTESVKGFIEGILNNL